MTGSQRPTVKDMNSGFTLVEMAMVLFIVTLLMAGLVPTITSQIEQQRTNDTRKQMSEIKEALNGYTIRYGALPCPARGLTPTGQSYSGVAAGVADCTLGEWGVLPWVTLGTSETDGWGNRFTYRVTSYFTDTIASATYGASCTPNPAPTQASFALCSVGNLTVKSAASGTDVAVNIPAVIISHGKNGAGAYTQKGTLRPVGSSTDEVENNTHFSNAYYVSHAQTPSFDDMVEWVTPNILYNRMVTAGKLP